jgi:hypothetical protein
MSFTNYKNVFTIDFNMLYMSALEVMNDPDATTCKEKMERRRMVSAANSQAILAGNHQAPYSPEM